MTRPPPGEDLGQKVPENVGNDDEKSGVVFPDDCPVKKKSDTDAKKLKVSPILLSELL